MPNTMLSEPVCHRWTVDDYHRMVETGLLAPDARVELSEGELVDMTPIGSLHAGTVNRLLDFFTVLLNRSAIVAAQNPVVLDQHSELQPDIAILRLRADYYTSAHPQPEDVLWLIEVADTTVRYDREVKVPLYARAGIAETWLLDLPNRQLEIYLDPSEQDYRQLSKPRPDVKVSPTLLPDLQVGWEI